MPLWNHYQLAQCLVDNCQSWLHGICSTLKHGHQLESSETVTHQTLPTLASSSGSISKITSTGKALHPVCGVNRSTLVVVLFLYPIFVTVGSSSQTPLIIIIQDVLLATTLFTVSSNGFHQVFRIHTRYLRLIDIKYTHNFRN